jgi:hypothetical protein
MFLGIQQFFSEELIIAVSDICRQIKNYIKNSDIDTQYLDYEIISKHDMAFNDLKVLSQEEKKKLLRMDYSYMLFLRETKNSLS